ncbi:MAG TPA: XdhC family protein [Nocardiopsis listeri]|uniref:XdhC family protein n=1 Tax=Nocardiopsis listeri TaxID=53440 RepID=UPI001D31FEC0|nr:XdhC family protein [Nocardiopsis listeri]HJE60066.1 XdhC family protein [Nocardiopsis listeri]
MVAIDVTGRGRELIAGRVPFVEATVVRAQVPASVRPGDGAIVLQDGSIEGFVGGQCAQGSVREAALGAIRDRRSVLLRVLPGEGEPFPETPGAHVVVNPCLSGGALEIFLRPRLPDPVVGVVGDSPIVSALREMAPPLGFVVESGSGTEVVAGATAVVVASHGGDEAAVIRSALDAGVGFVGLVASRRRGAAVLDSLELDHCQRGRVHAPVGLGIGASTPPEIALSILAQLVQEVRVNGLGAPEEPASQESTAPGTVVDPVCGMTVTVGTTTPHLEIDGQDVWFCCPGCRDRKAAEG